MNSRFPVLACALIMLTASGLSSAKDDAALAAKGKELVSVDGARLGQVYRVGPDGAAQVILGGKIVSVPATLPSSSRRSSAAVSSLTLPPIWHRPI